MKPALLLSIVSLVSLPVWSEDQTAGVETNPLSRQQVIILIKQRYGGRVLEIRKQPPPLENGCPDYRVKMISDGRVRVLHVDGSTGQVNH